MPTRALLLPPLLLSAWLLLSVACWAAEPVTEQQTRDPLGRSTPRGAVEGFLKAIDDHQSSRAAEYLDLRNLPPELHRYTPEQLAEGLAIVLQRATWIDLDQLSDDPQGWSDDGLPSYRDLLVRLETPTRPVDVLLQRVPDGAGGRIWKFSNATIADLQLLYDTYRYHPAVEWLARHLPDVSFLGYELFKWVTAVSIMLVATPFLIGGLWLLARWLVPPERQIHRPVRRFLLGPVLACALVVIGEQTLVTLGGGLAARAFSASYPVLTAVVIWLLWQSLNLLREVYSSHLIARERQASVALVRPLITACKLTVLLLGVLVWLDNLGFEVTAVLTGLGIGGVAVALVLQKPLEDVFGAVTLYTQQPIRIGDFGRFGPFTGTVEEISLRTTRIRTLDNSLVAVPNMRLASEPIENLSARQKFLYQPVLRLRNDSTSEQIQRVLTGIRNLLASDEQVIDEGARVRLTGIGTVSHDVSIFAYVDAQDWAGYLEAAERLNFSVLAVLDQVGVRLAVPLDNVLGRLP